MVLNVIGETELGHLILLRGVEIFTLNTSNSDLKLELQLKCPLSPNSRILQASIQDLSLADKYNRNRTKLLISIVYVHKSLYSSTLFLIEQQNSPTDNPLAVSTQNVASIVILEELELVNSQTNSLRVHIIPAKPFDAEIHESDESSKFRNKVQVLALSLEQCITVYQIGTCTNSENRKIEILSSECIPKCFYWAQWIGQHKSLAFAHTQKTIGDFGSSGKNLMSVFQFHEKYPREAVFNMPLEDTDPRSKVSLNICNTPNIFSESNPPYQLFVHTTGIVILVQIMPQENLNDSNITYKINLLHHDKTMTIKILCPEWTQGSSVHLFLINNGQHLAVFGSSKFLHLLDIGTLHEPSHHILINLPTDNVYLGSIMSVHTNDSKIIFTHKDLRQSSIEISSAILVPLYKSSKDLYSKLGILHYLLIHKADMNCVKKLIYDSSTDFQNLHLTEIFQEFILANSFSCTRKLLMQNLESFLHYIPYSNHGNILQNHSNERYSIKLCQNKNQVATMLLSPNQRVIPINLVDLWTSLWETNKIIANSRRFNSKSIAEKLLVSFQCYKPETLSRVTTPMSPSSPMICCQSLGDIAALFGRRQELQLPFTEQESCTANRQEYIYTVNLRELSTHLLKERKQWPVHCQTVAGKYMSSLVDSARLLLHIICLKHFPPTKNSDKGFQLIDSLSPESQLKLFLLFEHYSLGLGNLAVPLPQGFTPFFAYLGYRTLTYSKFLWNVRTGVFDLQIDLAKKIVEDLRNSSNDFETKQLQVLSLLPKSRSNRILNNWSDQRGVTLRARQHAHDLLTGARISRRMGAGRQQNSKTDTSKYAKKSSGLASMDTFMNLITAKAAECEIDVGLLVEATVLSLSKTGDMENSAQESS